MPSLFPLFHVLEHFLAMHSPSSLSFSSLVQYALVAALVYVLAGAPLSSLISELYYGGEVQSPVHIGVLENLAIPEANLSCSEHAFKGIYVLNREPLVVYIEGFLSEEEAEHVVSVRYVVRAGVYSHVYTLYS
jgi:prolyl 4-hydroxylase